MGTGVLPLRQGAQGRAAARRRSRPHVHTRAHRFTARRRVQSRRKRAGGANVTDQQSPRGDSGTPNAAGASNLCRNDARQASLRRAPRRRWSYCTLLCSPDTTVDAERPKPRGNARVALHLACVDARRSQLRRATRLPRLLHRGPEHNGSECSPPPPHRCTTAPQRILRMDAVRRCRPAEHAMHLRLRPGAALTSVV